MLRRNQYEDEAEILAAPSDEILTATQNDDNVTLSQPSPIRCLAQRDKLSEGRDILKITFFRNLQMKFLDTENKD